jgi:hypothetical protein
MKDATNFAQEYFKNMSDFYKSFDFTNMMPNTQSSLDANQKNLCMFFDLVHLMNEKAQMIFKKQMEVYQDNVEELFNAVKDLSTCPLEPKDMLDKQNEFTHKNTTRNMQHATELGALYTQATSEVFRKYADQMNHNMNCTKPTAHKKSDKK